MVVKLPRFQTRSILVVNWLIRQKAVISKSTRAARYTRTNQASGGVSRMVARAHGRRHSAAETRDHIPPRPASSGGVAAASTAIGYRPPLAPLGAVT